MIKAFFRLLQLVPREEFLPNIIRVKERYNSMGIVRKDDKEDTDS